MEVRSAFRRNRFAVVLLGVTAVAYAALIVHVLRQFPDIANGFDHQHTNVAAHLVRDGVYSTGSRDATGALLPTATVPPLFTALYAGSFAVFGITRTAHEAMRILQILAALGTIAVTYAIGRQWSVRVGRVAAVFAATDLTAFWFANNYEIPDTLLGFFLAVATLFLVRLFRGDVRVRNAVGASAFLGLAMWTKISPFLLWVPLALLLAFFLWRSARPRPRTAAAVLGAFVGVVVLFFGGWTLRNIAVVGTGSFASGSTSLRWNAAHVIAYQRGIPLAAAREELAATSTPPALLAQGEGAVELEGSRAMLRILLASPMDFAIVTFRALPGMFLGTFPPYLLFGHATADAWVARVGAAHGNRQLLGAAWRDGAFGYLAVYLVAKLHIVILLAGALAGALALSRRPRERWVLAVFALTIAYTIAVSGAAAQARYRTMVFPIVYALAGIGIVAGVRIFRPREDPASP